MSKTAKKQVAAHVPALRLQPRDIGMLEDLAEYVLLDTPTLRQRHFPMDSTGEAFLRRMRLFAAHELTRIVRPVLCFADGRAGCLPTVYTLDRRGAEVLAAVSDTQPRHIPSHDPSPETILHRLGVARDIHLVVNEACKLIGIPYPEWILEQDMYEGAKVGAPLAERFILYESWTTPEGKAASCRPDASSWLRIPVPGKDQPADLLIYWEYCRSTQTLKRIARRVEGYRFLHATEAFAKHWPQATNPTVRVFFVAQSDERLRNVADTIRGLPGAEIFRLTTVGALTPDQFFGPIWQTVDGELRPILRK